MTGKASEVCEVITMENLRGKVALVTGASGAIGSAIARSLATRDVSVAVSGRRQAVLDRLAVDLRRVGVRAVAVPADLRDFDGIDALVERTENELGPIDVLVNNAGIESCAAFTRRTRKELTDMVALNLTAPMLLTHRVLPGMLERRSGHVVFISSLAGKRGIGYLEPYSVTKAGTVMLAQALRAEYSAVRVGFSVVCPGPVVGDGMFQRYVDEGLEAPKMAGHTTIDLVAAKVLHAIERDLPEVHVNNVPLRPIFALAEIAPRLVERVAPLFGVEKFYREASANRGLLDPSGER